MNLIQSLINKVPILVEKSHLETSQAWQAYWQPILRVVSMQCLNPCRDIRQAAFSSLQRCLFAPGLASEKHLEWTNIFNGVLFPLVQELLKTEGATIDGIAVLEMRVQTSQLICKTFLHYLSLLYNDWDGIVPLWKDILAAMDRVMKSAGKGAGASELQEAARESLKNVLLVMASSDYLIPGPAPAPASSDAAASEKVPTTAQTDERTEKQKQLWQATIDILGRSAPALINDVFHNPHQQLPSSPRVTATASGGARSPKVAASPLRHPVEGQEAEVKETPVEETKGLGVETEASET